MQKDKRFYDVDSCMLLIFEQRHDYENVLKLPKDIFDHLNDLSKIHYIHDHAYEVQHNSDVGNKF